MCAPSRPSRPPAPPPRPAPPRPAPRPAPAPEPQRRRTTARRVGKNLSTGSPSQRGRGVLIRSRNPLGITAERQKELGERRSLLTLSPNNLTLDIGRY